MNSVAKLSSLSLAGLLWSFSPSLLADPANLAWLNSLFQDTLGRAPDAGEQAFYDSTLDGGSSPIVVSSAVVSSVAFNSIAVNGFYQSFLGHAADPAGLTSSVNALLGGARDEQVMSSLLGSPEYFVSRAAGNETRFVNQLYQDLLAHPADPSALSSYVPMLDAGAITRDQLASVVLSSAEYRTRFIGGLYDQYLHHSADPAEQMAYLNELSSGGTLDQVRAEVLASPEFFAQAQTVPEPRAAALFLAGGTGLLVLSRRKKIASSK